MLRYLTSGESHGKCMLTIVDGLPAGLDVEAKKINNELVRRMVGHGRGKRMAIEADKVEILSGLRKGRTIGSPVALMVKNVDQSIDKLPLVLEPRPGHADLSGVLKYGLSDVRDVLERASARETVARVGVGALAKILLDEFDIGVASHVTMIGGVAADTKTLGFNQIVTIAEKSPVRCADPDAGKMMCKVIEEAMEGGDTLGGVFEVIVKGVSFGMGFEAASRMGSAVHDEIFHDKERGFYRKTNNAGGIEGGMTNGESIIMSAVMKPISTLRKALSSVNIKTKHPVKATVERSDVCAVPAAGVIGEAVTAIVIANAMIEKFGGDSIAEMRRNYEGYLAQVRKF